MPRLLSLNNYHYRRGGSDAVFFDHDRLFHEAGWETAVFTMHHPKNQASPWSEYFIDELEFGHSYSLLEKLTLAGKVIYSREARSKLKKLLDRFSPDVAHAHCIYHHLSPSVLALLHEKRVPTVMTAHDLKLGCPAYKMLNKHGICEKCKNGNLLHVVLNCCIHDSLAVSSLVAIESAVHKTFGMYKRTLDKVIAPSQFYREKLISWGWPNDKIVYIPNFLECNGYVPDFSAGKYFLYFGRLAPEKGVDTLIRAASEAGVLLKIAGTGPYEEELKKIADGYNAEIEFLGYCSGEGLWELIRKARAVVLPSQWYENAPISLLEAYASGKPVIGARIGGIPEMVLEGRTGYLFESGNVSELTNSLVRVNDMKDSAITEMGYASREHVSKVYTSQRYLEDISKLYHSLGVKH